MRILLAEDDEMIGEAIQKSLREASYAVDWVKDGDSVEIAFSSQSYDLILLDLGLPEKDGMNVLNEIRVKDKSVPLIIISARDMVENRIAGLDHGADDYVIKPFEMSELLARMRAVVRRKKGVAETILVTTQLSLNPVTHEVTIEGKTQDRLTAKEFSLLEALMLRPGAILSRSELEDRVYGWGEEVASNAIEFIIHSLRRKIGKDAIKNVRGVGWMVSK